MSSGRHNKGAPVQCANGHTFSDGIRLCPNCGAEAFAKPWWYDLAPGALAQVMRYPNLTIQSSLRLTSDGLYWGDQSKKRIGYYDAPWHVLRKVEMGTYTVTKGKQHNAFGFGPLGVAFVAANALHNAHARGTVQYRHIRVTDGAGKAADFLTAASGNEVVAMLGPLSEALQLHYMPAPEPPTVPTTPTLGIADELTKLAALRDSGVLTDEEFAIQKARLLASPDSETPA